MWLHVPTYIKSVLVMIYGLQTCLPTTLAQDILVPDSIMTRGVVVT